MTENAVINKEEDPRLQTDIESATEPPIVPAMSRQSFFRALLAMHGLKWLGIMGILIIAGVVLSVVIDWEIIILSLMLVFIILPGLLLFLYFFHALKPLTLLNTSGHRFETNDDNLIITIEETGRRIGIPYKELTLYTTFGKGLIYTAINDGWLWIGEIFFENKEEFEEFIATLNSVIEKHKHESNPG